MNQVRKSTKDICVLGIDTSCDETSAAIVRNTSVLSNIVSSQVELHSESFEVGVADSDFVEGEAGDYLLRNAYGILSIVPKDIFEKLYTVLRG